jgi:2-methylisocitrate lyase-like PEP mutase family enzyme
MRLRQTAIDRDIIPFLGVYDAFSASLAGRHADGLFLSGFGFAASHYGLPDIGFVAWPDMVAFVARVRTICPEHHLLVDVDDGYGDSDIATHVVTQVRLAGASGIILEDQRRPRRCGHFNGKQLLDVDEFLVKLEAVLSVREDLFVIARTDAIEPAERLRRARAFEEAGADAILVDGLEDLSFLKTLSATLARPLAFNQMAGGKSPRCTLSELRELGVSLVNYSTPCLFAAQAAIDRTLADLLVADGALPHTDNGHVTVHACTTVLKENLAAPSAAAKLGRPAIRSA